jgi:hypothetical protein
VIAGKTRRHLRAAEQLARHRQSLHRLPPVTDKDLFCTSFFDENCGDLPH